MYGSGQFIIELGRLLYRIRPTFVTKLILSRGSGGKNAVQYYTINSWDEVSVKTWEHQTDLEPYGSLESRYWAGDPIQLGGDNAKYRRYRVQLAKRTLACAKGERHVVKLEGDRKSMIVTLLDRRYISKLPAQVGR